MNSLDGISFWEPMRHFLDRVVALFPVLAAVIVVLVAGLVAALVFEGVTRVVLRAIRFDRIAQRPNVADSMVRAGLRHSPSALVGQLVRWLVMIVALLSALSIMSAEATDEVTSALVRYLPRLAAGIFTFVIGYGASTFAGRSVLLWAVNARLQGGRWLAGGVQILMSVFFAALALENLGFGRDIAVVVLAILLGGAVLAAALAYGLGAKDLARQSLDRMTREMQEQDRDSIAHL
jgi:hypothetical protein